MSTTAQRGHLILRVNDLDASLRFYTELMGFEPKERKGPGTEVGARGAAPTLHFFDPNRHLIEILTYALTAAGLPS